MLAVIYCRWRQRRERWTSDSHVCRPPRVDLGWERCSIHMTNGRCLGGKHELVRCLLGTLGLCIKRGRPDFWSSGRVTEEAWCQRSYSPPYGCTPTATPTHGQPVLTATGRTLTTDTHTHYTHPSHDSFYTHSAYLMTEVGSFWQVFLSDTLNWRHGSSTARTHDLIRTSQISISVAG